MLVFALSFPSGRYHATPWGKHANEADVAWPPEPTRILRALIATWWRKADHDRFRKEALDELVDALAAEPPVYHLPEAIHTHVRAFMPAPKDRKLIYDGFLRLDPDAKLIVAWPSVSLTDVQKELCTYLLEMLGYLGRAESWVSARIEPDWDGVFNTRPLAADASSLEPSDPVEVSVPVAPSEWSEFRNRHIEGLHEMTKSKRRVLEATLPVKLADALAVDTSDWQRAGWSSPPPIRRIVYRRPELSPLPKRPTVRKVRRTSSGAPEAARFVLAGRPPPRIEDAVKIGEVARWALMSLGDREPPPEISGRSAQGALRDDPAHAHAFFLPEDADRDGFIDHLVIYCARGFSSDARRRLDRLTRLWRNEGSAESERGRKEWRLALEDIAHPEAFARKCALLRPSRTWRSVTPYLMPWHVKKTFGPKDQLSREIGLRLPGAELVEVSFSERSDSGKSTIRFHRFRSRGGLIQPDRVGRFVELKFSAAITGPVALGFACHYGLGLFVASDPA